MTDFRALCARMADELDNFNHPFPHPLATEARAALSAESLTPPPRNQPMTDFRALCAELLADYEQHLYRSVLADKARVALAEPQGEGECPACEGTPKPGNQPCAVCGRPAPPPADGEVGELVELFRYAAENDPTFALTSADMRHAADLLERLIPPQPIPASERLPRPEDCDAEGRCWWIRIDTWMLKSFAVIDGDPVPLGSHWLPAHALPVPEG